MIPLRWRLGSPRSSLRGRAVIGLVGPHRVTWTLDRGRALPER